MVKNRVENKSDLEKSDQATLNLNPSDSTIDSSDTVTIEKRQNWSNRVEFLLACIGYSVGLGNVWRFGYLCAKSGGGAFLIPYFLTLLIVAIPLMYMEFSIGQFTQRGPIGAMARICPLLKGTGIATVVISFLLTTYYVVIIGWDLFFLFSSFGKEVPWKTCNNTWNTEKCWDGLDKNLTYLKSNDSVSPSEEFFKRRILRESPSMEEFGAPNLDLVGTVLLAWIIIYFCIWKGVKSTGKVVYVTAIFPYIVIVIMLVRGVTLEGSWEGLKYFLVPKWKDLLKPSVWANAAIQNFNSIGVAFGGLISMSSFNKKNKRILGDVLTIAAVDAVTSIVCGCMVFSVMGYIASQQGQSVEDVVKAGPGLIFMVLPEALRNMDLAPLWSVLFFLMVFMLGIDSQFTMVETVATTIEDEFGVHIKKYAAKFGVKFVTRREILVLLICFITFFLSFPNLCPGGIYYFTVIDYFSAGISLFYIGFLETAAIVWLYGANRLAKNIYLMNGERPNLYFKICWYGVTPAFILIIWGFNWYEYTPLKYEDRQLNDGAQAFGWCIALISIAAIPLAAIDTFIKSPGKNFMKKIKFAITPTILDLDQEPTVCLSKSKVIEMSMNNFDKNPYYNNNTGNNYTF